ncbi:amidohydrolase family protein [Crateriforma spongiae]|uniref:amidohydrolase family protein n=1 Tax=Crateriforma spongiae TaxID=2724528 RepID=UPI001444BF25|nr:amidohydrolase family protein [Crateriforma spongiae]
MATLPLNMAPPTDDRTYQARWILPISRPPFQDGWVRVADGSVIEIGSGRPSQSAIDLGDAALMPGLVNAHTHLEFSDLSEPIGIGPDGRSTVPLSAWIALVTRRRFDADLSQRSRVMQTGLRESIDAGVRLIGDIVTPDPAGTPAETTNPTSGPPSSIDTSPATVIRFAEVIGLSLPRMEERWAAASNLIENDANAGLSPHAPYSMRRDGIRQVIDQARSLSRPVAMHVAESPDERELIRNGGGAFADALRSMGVWQDDVFPWSDTTVDGDYRSLIERLTQAPRALLVHGNDLTDQELDTVAGHPDLSIVYCPRTHDYFGYAPHPMDRCIAKGIRVALGTDSRASNPDLDLWSEVRFLLNHRQDIAPECVLRAATLSGADALGKPMFGRIEAGCHPGLGMVATTANDLDTLFRDLAVGTYQPVL